MQLVRQTRRAFALYEVMLGVFIFMIGVLALGRSVENCLNASALAAEDDRIRQILANRMAEVQAAPGAPDPARDFKIDTGYGTVKLTQQAVAARMTEEDKTELVGIRLVTLTAEWVRGNAKQTRSIGFYVYRPG